MMFVSLSFLLILHLDGYKTGLLFLWENDDVFVLYIIVRPVINYEILAIFQYMTKRSSLDLCPVTLHIIQEWLVNLWKCSESLNRMKRNLIKKSLHSKTVVTDALRFLVNNYRHIYFVHCKLFKLYAKLLWKLPQYW